MSILTVTSEPPWPLDSGGHLRSFHLHNEMAAHLSVNMICPINQSLEARLRLPGDMRCSIELVKVAPRTVLSETRRIIAAQLAGEPYVMYRRHFWKAVNDRWLASARYIKPRVLWYDHIDSYLYHRENRMIDPNVYTVLDMHNIYSLILYRMAEETTNYLRKRALLIEASRLARIERQACQSIDIVVAVSEEEASHFRTLGARHVVVAPNGVSLKSVTPTSARTRASTSPIILFLGAMNWQPNVSACVCLARDIFPIIRNRFPAAQLKLVGREPDAVVRELGQAPGVTVTGTVPDVMPYLAEASVMAVPLLSGGGTRLKILEAFAASVPVVSTDVGAEGIEAIDGVHLRIATVDRFAQAIVDTLNDASREDMTSNARQLIKTHYEWAGIAGKTVAFLQELPPKNVPTG